MQNGLATKGMMAERIGSDRAVGAMVRLGGTFVEPGHVTHLTNGLFVVGELDGRMTETLGKTAPVAGEGRANDQHRQSLRLALGQTNSTSAS